jgi:steroid 5-alpha reductase family enzyme
MGFLPVFQSDSYNLGFTFGVVLGLQVLAFAVAATRKTDTLTDITYSLTFALVAILLLVGAGRYEPTQVLIAAAIVIWAARLGGYLLVRVLRTGRDKRFDGIRENPLKFAGFWLLQTVTIWTVLLPATLALSSPAPLPLGWQAWAGGAIWLAGLLIEAIADQQKFAFRNDPGNDGRWIDRGLWRYARHPNYFGEMLCWWGLFLVASPALDGWAWLAAAGPVFLTLLLLFGSGIPTVARSQRRRYGQDPAFQQYLRRTSLLVPLPPRKV